MPSHGLILDLDDTLFDSRAAYAAAVEAALVPLAPERRAGLFDSARAAVKTLLPAGHVAARNRWLYFKRALEMAGSYSTAALVEMMARYETALAAHLSDQWARLDRGKLFERLTARVPIVLVTNENLRTQILKLAAVDPKGRHFRHLVTSEELGVEKPSPRPFEVALARLGLAAKEVCAVGNSLVDDVGPARALGCVTLWTREFETSEGSAPAGVKTIHRLDEVESYVQ